jgi:hypothetical protein
VSDLEAGKVSIQDVINKNVDNPAIDFVEIVPDFAWQEIVEDDKYKNKFYNDKLVSD